MSILHFPSRPLVAAALIALAVPALADEAPHPAAGTAAAAAANPTPEPTPNRSVTRHSGTFGGQRIDYVATAGETFLRGDDGKPKAAIFSVSYVKAGNDPNRPVTFLFNGGPG